MGLNVQKYLEITVDSTNCHNRIGIDSPFYGDSDLEIRGQRSKRMEQRVRSNGKGEPKDKKVPTGIRPRTRI
jgi:hypothetical protein